MQEGAWQGLGKNLVQPVPKRILESAAKSQMKKSKWMSIEEPVFPSMDLRKIFRVIQKVLEGHEVLKILSNIATLLSSLYKY